MLYQGAGDEGLRCTEFDERKAIAAIQDGRAIIPIQIEALGKRLEKGFNWVVVVSVKFLAVRGAGNGEL